MKKKSLNLSGKIDSLRLEAIETISDVSNSLNIPFFLIGATARDFILEHGYGFSTHRATLDIDFGVKVPNWEKYQILRKSLIKTENISESTIVHRLIFRKRLKIDLIPFGPISNRENSIRWPPNDDVVMNILGFEESFNYAQSVILRTNPLFEVKVVSLTGLAVMKIFSWKDRYPESSKDAQDLELIIRLYSDAGNTERIYDDLLDLLGSSEFDYIEAGARLLGRDIACILTDTSKKQLLDILKNETGEQDRYRLIEDMNRTTLMQSNGYFGEMHKLLEEMIMGIQER